MMAQPWDHSRWGRGEYDRWWAGWHESPSGLWQHDGWWHDDGYRRDWANTQFIGPASNNAQAAREAAVAAEEEGWNETLQQWGKASSDAFHWSDPDDADRFEADEQNRESLSAVAAVAAEHREDNETAESITTDPSIIGSWTTD